MRTFRRKIRGWLPRLGIAALLAVVLGLAWWVRTVPRPDRRWILEHSRLPAAEFAGDLVRLQGVRDFRARGAAAPDTAWFDRTYDLGRLESLWFVLAVFHQDTWRGPAHSMLSFGFADGDYVVVSVEARKEEGEAYSALKGLFKQYELIYVIGTERDLVLTRAAQRPDEVYLYPIGATPEKIRELFVGMLASANRLHRRPEFYNTLTNSCTSRLRDHVNAVAPGRIPASWKVLLPGYADGLVRDLGLLRGDLDLEQARALYWINERARRHQDDPEFSRRIRELPPHLPAAGPAAPDSS